MVYIREPMVKIKNNIENSIEDKVAFILSNISEDDKAEILYELIRLALMGKKGEMLEYINGWEATAEINSMPEIKQKILSRSESLRKRLSEKHNA